MASQTFDLKFIASLEDRTSGSLSVLQSKIKGLEPTFKSMAIIGAAGFTAIASAIGLSIKETVEYESVQNRLSHILKTSRGATQDQVDVLFEQAKALEKVGVVSAKSIIQGQAQLATFDLEVESIQRLTPAILDYVVAEKGAGASTEDLKQLSNGLAQALQGNFTSLTQTGFVLDEATRELIKNGTEVERTTALVAVLNSTYKGFNEAARSTAEGSLIVLQIQFENLRKVIGDAFTPILIDLVKQITPMVESIMLWIEQNPELTKQIVFASLALFGMMTVIGTLSLAVLAFNPIVAGIILALVGIFLIVRNLDEILKLLKNDSEAIWAGIKIIFQEAIDWIISNTLKPLMDWIDRIISAISRIRESISSVTSKVGGAISSTVSRVIPFAEGGIVTRPTLGLVGESGPEAIIPLSRGVGGFGGVNITITGNTFMSDRESAEMIGNMIIKNLPLKLS